METRVRIPLGCSDLPIRAGRRFFLGCRLVAVQYLLDAVLRDPLSGIGKPEQLKHVLQGCWSRRIDEEHRLVYLVDRDGVVVLQARYHYEH